MLSRAALRSWPERRSSAFCPEDIAIGQSEIDYVFDLDERKYALEHTVIEAFDGQLRLTTILQSLSNR